MVKMHILKPIDRDSLIDDARELLNCLRALVDVSPKTQDGEPANVESIVLAYAYNKADNLEFFIRHFTGKTADVDDGTIEGGDNDAGF